MNATAIIERCEAAGVRLTAAGDKLRLAAAAEPPPDLVDALRIHKAEILAALTTPVRFADRPHHLQPANWPTPALEAEIIDMTDALAEARRVGAAACAAGMTAEISLFEVELWRRREGES